MFQNYQDEKRLSNQANSPDMDNSTNKYMSGTINWNEQNQEKNSYSGTSISSNNRLKENTSYSNFISKIKLNYNLMHPRKRVQTIILHSNLNKSVNISDTSANDMKYNDINDNTHNDNLNTGFILDNSGHFTTNNNRRSTGYFQKLNEERMERLKKEEEKNNQSAEANKNSLNINFNNDDNNKDDKGKINLGEVFQQLKENSQKDKVFLSQNEFIDNPNITNNEEDNSQNSNDNFSSSYQNKNNPYIDSYQNDINRKKGKNIYMNQTGDINNLSTNMYTNNNSELDKFSNNEKELISSFNNRGINNTFTNLGHSYSYLNNNMDENKNKRNNNIEYGTQYTFKDSDNEMPYNSNNNNFESQSLSQNIPQNNIPGGDIDYENDNSQENINKRTRTIPFYGKLKEINNLENSNNINKNKEEIEYNNLNNDKKYTNNNNIEYSSHLTSNNSIINEKNNNNNQISGKDNNLSLEVKDSDKKELEKAKKSKKGKGLLKSFLYGLLFGSTATGIFWLKDEKTRKYFLEKMKGINFDSIIKFLKGFFSNPKEFFKRIFSHERMKDYVKVFGITLASFLDKFDKSGDWFRLIGMILCIYLIWLIIKSFIKACFKVWQYFNQNS